MYNSLPWFMVSSKNNDGSSLCPPSIAGAGEIVACRQGEDAHNGWMCSKRVVSFLIIVLFVVTATFSGPWFKQSTRHSMRNLRSNDKYPSIVVSNRLSLDRSLQEISNNNNITGGNNTDVCTMEYCTQNYEQKICSMEDDSWISAVPVAVQVIITIILLATSALFSGLTLGLLSLDVTGLEIIMAGDDPKQAQYAKDIYPIRKHGNLLLCTLLLGNVSVNSLVSIFLAAFTGGTVGFLTSTVLLLLFGEMLPLAVCSRYPLQIGSATLPIVKFVRIIFFPMAFPLAKCLDLLLGRELISTYSNAELMHLLTIHVKENVIDQEAANTMTGALTYKNVSVKEAMTPIDKTFMLGIDEKLSFDTIGKIFKTGYSRIPIYEISKSNVVGILLVKDLIFIDPDDAVPIRSFIQIFGRSIHAVWPDDTLGDVLAELKKGRSYLAVVRDVNNTDESQDPFYEAKGIITLEDIVERILGDSIVDETDTTHNILNTFQVNERLQAIFADKSAFELNPPAMSSRLLPPDASQPLVLANGCSRRRGAESFSSSSNTGDSLTVGVGSDRDNVSGSHLSRRKKKPKGMPRRPLSAYNFYFKAQRTNILAEPGVGFEESGRIAGRLWRELSDAEKRKYIKLAEKDGERYRKETDAYNEMRNKLYKEEANRPLSPAQFPLASAMACSDVRMRTPVTNLMYASSDFRPNPQQSRNASSTSLHHGQFSASPGSAGKRRALGPLATSYDVMESAQGHESAHPSAVQPRSCQDASMHLPVMYSHASHQEQQRPTSSQVDPTYPHLMHAHASHQGQHSMRGPPAALFPMIIDRGVEIDNGGYFPIPPGMEIALSDSNGIDRKYRVNYQCFSMTREAAHHYVENLSGVSAMLNSDYSTGNQPTTMPDATARSLPTAPAHFQDGSQPFLSHQHYNGVCRF